MCDVHIELVQNLPMIEHITKLLLSETGGKSFSTKFQVDFSDIRQKTPLLLMM